MAAPPWRPCGQGLQQRGAASRAAAAARAGREPRCGRAARGAQVSPRPGLSDPGESAPGPAARAGEPARTTPAPRSESAAGTRAVGGQNGLKRRARGTVAAPRAGVRRPGRTLPSAVHSILVLNTSGANERMCMGEAAEWLSQWRRALIIPLRTVAKLLMIL